MKQKDYQYAVIMFYTLSTPFLFFYFFCISGAYVKATFTIMITIGTLLRI